MITYYANFIILKHFTTFLAILFVLNTTLTDINIDPQSFPRLIFEYIFHPFTLPISVFILHQWPRDWKRSVFIPIPKTGNAKECSNYRIIALILHASKVMLKILQARLQQYVNRELPDVQAGFRKGRGMRDQRKRAPGKYLFLLY